jgi:hypothetical protein
MSRDGRGNPGRIVLKNQPRLRLADVLRRRRTTLKKLLDEIGLSTYGGLINWCARMGIAPPTADEFDAVIPPTSKVNSPQEGVVVLEPPAVVDEHTGQPIDPEAPVLEPGVEVVTEPTEPAQKKRRAKKDNQPSDA